ncbi:MAG: hypothetical protein GYA24_19430 [Candidatus Lokiarchaeota archaeon]|nr:hypothetical protein [Candidatus Lokiarchaeota archaeon]
MAAKPAVKDISIVLTNAPQLMLGTKQYPLNFTIMNLRNESKDISMQFSSNSLKMDSTSIDLALAPQEKKVVTVTVSPDKDGALDLSVTINQKRIIKYTETVLEGHENDMPQEPARVAASAPQASVKAPATPVQKPASPLVKPVKPAGPPAVQKPSGTPMKPVKPAGAAPPAVQKPVGAPVKSPVATTPAVSPVTQQAASSEDALEKRIMAIKDKYMAARTRLQSLPQGSPEYKSTYQDAVKLKDQYDKLKAIFESGGTMADAEAAVPSEPTVPARAQDPVAELKELGQRYTNLKNKLATLAPGTPEHEKVKQEALAVYKEYNDKKAKAKEQGLAV